MHGEGDANQLSYFNALADRLADEDLAINAATPDERTELYRSLTAITKEEPAT